MPGKLTVIIDCPDWCESSPEKHLDDGSLCHHCVVGSVEVPGDLTGAVEQIVVRLQRYDAPDSHGEMTIMVGDYSDLTVTQARQLAGLLLGAAHVCEQEKAGQPLHARWPSDRR